MISKELLYMMREQEHRPGKNEREDQPSLEISQHALMALARMALSGVALSGMILSSMTGMLHLRLASLSNTRLMMFTLHHFLIFCGFFRFIFCHGLLIRRLMMRVG